MSNKSTSFFHHRWNFVRSCGTIEKTTKEKPIMDAKIIETILKETAYVRMGGSAEELQCAK